MSGPSSAHKFGAHTRDHASTLVVASLSSAFGVVLLQATGIIATTVQSDVVGQSDSVRLALSLVTTVFTVIAFYVGAIVTANTFSTIVAGRVRQIALLRLIGAKAGTVRRAVATEGLLVGAAGALVGLAVGMLLSVAAVAVGIQQAWLPALEYHLLDPVVALPVAVVALVTWAAAWVGSRRVVTVSPMEATGAAVESSQQQGRRRTVRNVFAALLVLVGFALLALGVIVGLSFVGGLLIAFTGGLLSFTGIVLGAHLVMPPVLRMVGRLFGSGATSRLAAENAVRFPERSTRATIGLVIGVTLVVMFAVTMESYRSMVLDSFADSPEMAAVIDQSVTLTTSIFLGLVGFSAVIAAIGLVNNLSLSVLQRTRELGLLRALGFTGRQVRAMILAESAQMTIAAIGLGLVLGVFYGWAGAQSLLGSISGELMAPALPWPLLAATVMAGAVLTVLASLAPARRATTVSPMLALSVD
ncbi:ABC transporter permease [Microterricola viridarii]|uniref:ABC transporter permease n=1 Tax=Microterricola viridarii TaxID=412690 RepID=A0A0X8E1K8_9MICO|nr:ABC transporter permease [Microterricola viridarii]AMB58660.1 ABC transporter permease [Microterricola viridarii]